MRAGHTLWSHTLAQRIGLLRKGTRRIAFIAPKPDFGSFRYRCFNAVDALNTHSTKLSASYFFLSDLEVIDDLSDYADVLVVQRIPYDSQLDALFRRFRRRGKPIFFDIDDLVFDTRYATLVASNLRYRLEGIELNRWTSFIANTGIALSMADGVITTTSYLGERIKDFCTTPVHVVSNALNAAQLEVSTAARANQKQHHDGGLHIGYFSGSHSHSQDFEVVSESLAQYLEGSPTATLTVVGHLEIPQRFASLAERIITVPFMDFLDMQNLIASIDVNIVPLQNSVFTSSKSELKFFEAAIVDTLTLASNVPVFSGVIKDGHNGFLTGADGWLEALTNIEQLGAKGRASIAQAAREDCLARYVPQETSRNLEAILDISN
jgi:glycosyltransferase involved in cell wall biosynthesis